MSWIILFLAGLFEMGWAVDLKYTEGFSKLPPTVFTAFVTLVSLGLLGLVMEHLPLGTAYAVQTEVDTVGTVIAGTVLLGKPTALLRLASVALIVYGLAGLKLSH